MKDRVDEAVDNTVVHLNVVLPARKVTDCTVDHFPFLLCIGSTQSRSYFAVVCECIGLMGFWYQHCSCVNGFVCLDLTCNVTTHASGNQVPSKCVEEFRLDQSKTPFNQSKTTFVWSHSSPI